MSLVLEAIRTHGDEGEVKGWQEVGKPETYVKKDDVLNPDKDVDNVQLAYRKLVDGTELYGQAAIDHEAQPGDWNLVQTVVNPKRQIEHPYKAIVDADPSLSEDIPVTPPPTPVATLIEQEIEKTRAWDNRVKRIGVPDTSVTPDQMADDGVTVLEVGASSTHPVINVFDDTEEGALKPTTNLMAGILDNELSQARSLRKYYDIVKAEPNVSNDAGINLMKQWVEAMDADMTERKDASYRIWRMSHGDKLRILDDINIFAERLFWAASALRGYIEGVLTITGGDEDLARVLIAKLAYIRDNEKLIDIEAFFRNVPQATVVSQLMSYVIPATPIELSVTPTSVPQSASEDDEVCTVSGSGGTDQNYIWSMVETGGGRFYLDGNTVRVARPGWLGDAGSYQIGIHAKNDALETRIERFEITVV